MTNDLFKYFSIVHHFSVVVAIQLNVDRYLIERKAILFTTVAESIQSCTIIDERQKTGYHGSRQKSHRIPFIWHYNTWLSQFLLFKMRQYYKTFYRRALKRRTKSTYLKYNLHCMFFLAHFHSVWKNALLCSLCRLFVHKLFFFTNFFSCFGLFFKIYFDQYF